MSSDNAMDAIRVLVIDDYQSMRSIVRQLLAQVGIHSVDEAANGIEALDLLTNPRAADPDVIICDLHMDGMDGMEFCNRLRRDESIRDRHIPVLILTGESDDLMLEVTQQTGATAVLRKPISAPDLLQHIQSAIGFRT